MKRDFRPEKLSAFLLTSTPLLKGFELAKPEMPQPPVLDKPNGAIATLNLRFFHGPCELRYSVLQFTSKQALTQWDQEMRRSSPGWFSPREAPMTHGVQMSRLGGKVQPGIEMPRAVVVGNHVIIVSVFQHQEMLRRQPELSKRQLSAVAMNKLLAAVLEELIKRARAGATAI